MPYTCIRLYRLRAGTAQRVQRMVARSLLPLLEAQPGFLEYRFMVAADDRAVSESLWEHVEEAASADAVEADWVRSALSPELDGLPDSLIGAVEVAEARVA
ncbi:MAG: antibiotic biosynthesis monooxygenase [Chloroflexi bacterium]|jgi:hypothetical protein|nr:antibiotic biosynthesis monooxygenase [Chloroflexota bacterium]